MTVPTQRTLAVWVPATCAAVVLAFVDGVAAAQGSLSLLAAVGIGCAVGAGVGILVAVTSP